MKCMDEPRAESGFAFVSTLHLEVSGRGMRRRKEKREEREREREREKRKDQRNHILSRRMDQRGGPGDLTSDQGLMGRRAARAGKERFTFSFSFSLSVSTVSHQDLTISNISE